MIYRLPCNSEYESRICDREVGDDSCPCCNNRCKYPGINTLEVTKVQLVPEWSPNNEHAMTDFFDTSAYRALWICTTCKGEYISRIRDRELGDDSCPYCANIKPLAGFNTLEVCKAELVLEWSSNNERPISDFLVTATYKALWICPICTGEYLARIYDRELGDDSCPYCNGKKVLPGYNSFKVNHSDLMNSWDYVNNYTLVNPDEILDTYSYPVWWQCEKDISHKYLMSPKQRLYYQKRHMESCTICKGYRRKRRHFI